PQFLQDRRTQPPQLTEDKEGHTVQVWRFGQGQRSPISDPVVFKIETLKLAKTRTTGQSLRSAIAAATIVDAQVLQMSEIWAPREQTHPLVRQRTIQGQPFQPAQKR